MEQLRITLKQLSDVCFGTDGLFDDYRNFTPSDPAQKIRTRVANQQTITRVVYHCDDAPNWSPERLSSFFVFERKFPICGYHYYVRKDKIHHMVGENIITYHVSQYNKKSVSFSMDYFAFRDEPMNVVLDKDLYENNIKTGTYLCLKFMVPPIKRLPLYSGLVGHRELPGTGFIRNKQDNIQLRKICPGLRIDLNLFRYQVTKRIQNVINQFIPRKLAEDGVFGPKTKEQFYNFYVEY